MNITLDIPIGHPGFIIKADDGRTKLIQSDWEYPDLAVFFGFSLRSVQTLIQKCLHRGTDGTVSCLCGVTATEFIEAAGTYLQANDGKTITDPGYFC